MNLDLHTIRPHRLDLEPMLTSWDGEKDCIALILDGINDDRTPVLTREEARGLAFRLLTLAAEEVDQ